MPASINTSTTLTSHSISPVSLFDLDRNRYSISSEYAHTEVQRLELLQLQIFK